LSSVYARVRERQEWYARANLVILDDPTQSLDIPHKKALAKMLAEESKEKQIILATQDQEFQEQLVKLVQPNRHLKVRSWSTEGPVIS